jgi:hypothetical protein
VVTLKTALNFLIEFHGLLHANSLIKLRALYSYYSQENNGLCFRGQIRDVNYLETAFCGQTDIMSMSLGV